MYVSECHSMYEEMREEILGSFLSHFYMGSRSARLLLQAPLPTGTHVAQASLKLTM